MMTDSSWHFRVWSAMLLIRTRINEDASIGSHAHG